MTNFLGHSFNPQSMADVAALDEIPFWSAPFGFMLLSVAKMKRNIRALDIGCGTGFPLIELAERLGGGSELYGVDIWREAVERARHKILARGLKNITVLEHAAEDLPFDDHFFDLVVSNNGLNNVQDLNKVLSEIHRVCKTDGQLVFTVNLPETMKEFYDVYEDVLRHFQKDDAIVKMKEHIHEKRKPMEEIQSLLHRASFKIDSEMSGDFSYRFANAAAMFDYYVIREFFLPAWTAILPNDNVPEVFSEIERRLDRIADVNGELKLTVPFVCFDCSRVELFAQH